MAANELEEALNKILDGYGNWTAYCENKEKYGPQPERVSDTDALDAILSLIESEKVKAVEEYKSAQKKEIPVPRGISGKKLERILIDESRYVDPETAKLISDNIEELF